VVVRDTRHLEELLLALAAIGPTTTSIILSSPIEGRPLLPALLRQDPRGGEDVTGFLDAALHGPTAWDPDTKDQPAESTRRLTVVPGDDGRELAQASAWPLVPVAAHTVNVARETR
jgi:hypothetical protein